MPQINTDLDTAHYQEGCRLDHTPSSAVSPGDIVDAGKGLYGFADDDIAASRLGALALTGIRLAQSASATTFSVGDDVYWDASAEKAVAADDGLDGADLLLGVCVIAKTSGQNAVAFVPVNVLDRYNCIRPIVYEFDCDATNGDTDEHILIPANMNKTGLVFKGAMGIVTEQFAGDSEDQGVVTIEDEDDGAICTLTPSDAGADAVGDIIVSSIHWGVSTTGTAWKTVAAGKAVQGYVSQQTDGNTVVGAGKMRVYIDVCPLL